VALLLAGLVSGLRSGGSHGFLDVVVMWGPVTGGLLMATLWVAGFAWCAVVMRWGLRRAKLAAACRLAPLLLALAVLVVLAGHFEPTRVVIGAAALLLGYGSVVMALVAVAAWKARRIARRG
jgi:hypothetical protein